MRTSALERLVVIDADATVEARLAVTGTERRLALVSRPS